MSGQAALAKISHCMDVCRPHQSTCMMYQLTMATLCPTVHPSLLLLLTCSRQAVLGLLSAGPIKSVVYLANKLKKAWR